MGQLHKVVGIAVSMIMVLGATTAFAQGYCALTVRVKYPNGRPADALVTVQEPGGRNETRRQNGDEVQFCDLGILPITVKVGGDGTCNQVIVNNVRVAWNTPMSLLITYDVASCLVETPPPPIPVCRTVLRISDSNGNWIPGAHVHLSSGLADRAADKYGRASFITKLGETTTGSVEAVGYVQQDFNVTCDRSQPVHDLPLRLSSQRANGNPAVK